MRITVDGHEVYVVEDGGSVPTLFLHGHPDSADMWSGLFVRLRDHYRCIAPDLPGFGRSRPVPGVEGSLERMAGWVDGFVGAFGIQEPLNLVVHNFGGHFGLAWAILHPAKIRHLVIMNTNFFSDYRWHFVARILRTPLIGELALAGTSQGTLASQLRKAAPKMPKDYAVRTAIRSTISAIRSL